MTSLPTAPAPGSPARGPVVGLRRRRLRAWAITGAVLFGFVLAALVVTAYLRAAFGVQALLLGTLVALLPLTVVIPTFVWLDRLEAEPTRYLLAAFAWGALVAVIIAGTLNTSAILVLRQSVSADGATVVTAVLVAPFVEEAAKGMGVLLFWWLARREFDGLVDGMVYAGVVAAGFAFTENIQYFAQAWTSGGREAFTVTVIGRAVLSPFAHPMFTVLTGIGVGVAASTRSTWLKLSAPVAGYLGAVVLHSLWNFSSAAGASGFLTAYVVVGVPVFVAWVALIAWARRREGRLIAAALQPYAAAGWLGAEDVVMLGTVGRRHTARRWARQRGGPAGAAAMVRFQEAASELALLRQRREISPPTTSAQAYEQRLLATIASARQVFLAGPGQSARGWPGA